MADKLIFALVSPEREVFHGPVDHVVVPGSEGEFGVSPHHAPVMAVVKAGALRVFDDGAVRRIFVNGGFADVTPEGLTVLAEDAVDLAEVDPAQLEQQLKDAADDVRDAGGDDQRVVAQHVLARLEAIKQAMARA